MLWNKNPIKNDGLSLFISMENSIFRFLRWKNYFCHDKRLAQFSLAIHFGIYWASTSAVIYAARQASMNLINHEGVQDGNFMRLCNQTDCFRELRGCFWVPWLWLWKINLQQRAPISANERELKRCAFLRIHTLVQKPDEDSLLGTLSGHKLHNHRAVVTILTKPRKCECPC